MKSSPLRINMERSQNGHPFTEQLRVDLFRQDDCVPSEKSTDAFINFI